MRGNKRGWMPRERTQRTSNSPSLLATSGCPQFYSVMTLSCALCICRAASTEDVIYECEPLPKEQIGGCPLSLPIPLSLS